MTIPPCSSDSKNNDQYSRVELANLSQGMTGAVTGHTKTPDDASQTLPTPAGSTRRMRVFG